jgi:NAD-dependent dihydropyrimidine dehydrogenase PreA subunit
MDCIGANIPEDQSYSWIEVDQSRCNRCGTCIDMCPMDVLSFSRTGLPYMKYRDDCWYCDVCVFVCPRKAIQMKDLPYLIR